MSATTSVLPPETTVRSIYADSQLEALKHKWIESEKAGRDLGEEAIRRWVQEHWWGYLRARWVEHLEGKCFWAELAGCDYGLLLRDFAEEKTLLFDILQRLKDGQENLDIVLWACQNNIPTGDVLRILEYLDINSTRLVHRFES